MKTMKNIFSPLRRDRVSVRQENVYRYNYLGCNLFLPSYIKTYHVDAFDVRYHASLPKLLLRVSGLINASKRADKIDDQRVNILEIRMYNSESPLLCNILYLVHPSFRQFYRHLVRPIGSFDVDDTRLTTSPIGQFKIGLSDWSIVASYPRHRSI